MKKQRAALNALCLLTAIMIAGLCSQSSPLYPANIWPDANCLLTVGRVMKDGGVLYRDIYEQKGPTLYLIHMLGAWISDTSFFGVFVMEALSLFAALRIACSLVARRTDARLALCACVLTAALLFSGGAFMQGDSAEEFCLPALLGALALAIGAYELGRPMARKALFICGLLAGYVATVKFTVLGLFIGLCIAEGVLALREGGIKRALESAVVFLGGMLLPAMLWCAYFAAHGALGDFYTAYVHNNVFLYTAAERTALDVLFDLYQTVRMNPLWTALAGAGCAALLLNRREALSCRLALLSMALCALAAVFLLGRVFAYYPLALGAFAFAGAYGLLGMPSLRRALAGKRGGFFGAACCALALCACLNSPNAPLRGVKREELAQTRLAAFVHPGATLLQYSHLDDGLYLFSGRLPTEKYFCRLNVAYDEMDAQLDRYLEEAIPDYVLVSWEELPERFDRYQWVATDAGYDDQNRINKALHLYRRR